MIQTGFDLPQGVSFGLNSGKMKLAKDSRIDLTIINIIFVSDLRFIWILGFEIWILCGVI